MDIKIREYLPEDREAVKNCILELHEDEYGRRPHFWVSPSKDVAEVLLNHLLNSLQKSEGKIYVGVLDGEVVGWLVVKAVKTEGPDVALKKYGYINELGVLRKCHGHGIGLALMKQAEEFIKSLGLEWMGLNVSPTNPALDFYRKLGYEEKSFRMEKKIN